MIRFKFDLHPLRRWSKMGTRELYTRAAMLGIALGLIAIGVFMVVR